MLAFVIITSKSMKYGTRDQEDGLRIQCIVQISKIRPGRVGDIM